MARFFIALYRTNVKNLNKLRADAKRKSPGDSNNK